MRDQNEKLFIKIIFDKYLRLLRLLRLLKRVESRRKEKKREEKRRDEKGREGNLFLKRVKLVGLS
jgi:hypothetical protein